MEQQVKNIETREKSDAAAGFGKFGGTCHAEGLGEADGTCQAEDLGGALIVDGGTERLSRSIEDYPGGIVVPIDKPYRWTSADVIRKVKFAAIRHFGKRNLKVGHAGTLDPLATGILIVCIGNATKLAQALQDHDKEYVAGISFGATTPSYDLEKDIDRQFPYDHITEELVRIRLGEFVGEQEQVAPLFSAKSVDGVRAYELARKLFKAQLRAQSAGGVESGSGISDGGSGLAAGSSVVDGSQVSEEPRPAGVDGAVFDQAAAGLIRTAKIRISEAELLGFWPAGNTVIADRRREQGLGLLGQIDCGIAGEQAGQATVSTAEIMNGNAAAKPGQSGNRQHGGASGRINVADTSALGLPRADIRISCSKGTYIRAFARDLGEALGSGAHLDALRRTKNGPFTISRTVSLDRILSLLA